MKKIYLSVAALSVFASSIAFSETEIDPTIFQPQTVRMLPKNTFLPTGFDDNDNAQLVISGNLPNICYRVGSAVANVDQKEKKIYIQNFAYRYSGGFCAQVNVPYMQVINLGILSMGQYQVMVQDDKNQLHSQGLLNVAVSKTALPDDFLYAPVDEVSVQANDLSPDRLVIRGQFSSDCMHLQEVKVSYRSSHIIEVLPIATMDDTQVCHPVTQPFQSEVQIQASWKGSTLVYTRSLNGQALSKVIDL